MNGRIPANYPFTDIVLKDKNAHLKYNLEIVFFKTLPQLRWVIPLWFGLLVFYCVLLFFPSRFATKIPIQSKS